MKRGHCIGVDTHSQFCEVAILNPDGELMRRQRCGTSIPALRAIVEAVPGPRRLVIEEGPLAGWLWRNLRGLVAEMVVSEPRRNRLIAKDGDKDDDLDAEKLARLLWGGYVKKVHQLDTESQAVFRQHVSLYHERVNNRVAQGHRIWSLFRRHGVVIRQKDFIDREDRPELLERLPLQPVLREDVESLWESYDMALAQEARFRQTLVKVAKEHEVVRRFVELPGVGWVRAATLFVFLDTPWRFRKKEALWKYLGIGLERQRSGNGPVHLGVPQCVNRVLKSTILGAARSAIAQKENPFADQHRRWLEQGLSPRLARRNVARSLAATLWGLWKNGNAYRPEWVGQAQAAIAADEASGQ